MRSMRHYYERFMFHLAGKGADLSRPRHIDIELTNHCNLKCIMCPHGDDQWSPEKGMMDTEYAKYYIRQAADMGVYSIKLQFRGESALHKDLSALVAYAKRQGIGDVMLNTNLVAFSADGLERVIKAGLDTIIVSVDGATKETYEKIRIKSSWEKLIANLHLLRKLKKKYGTFVRIQMTAQDANEAEIALFKRQHKWADEVYVKPKRGTQIAMGRKLCGQPYQRMVIGWDGTVYGCCNAWNEESVVGYAKIDHLISIWNQPSMDDLRYKARDPSKGDPCESCQVWSSYKWRKL